MSSMRRPQLLYYSHPVCPLKFLAISAVCIDFLDLLDIGL